MRAEFAQLKQTYGKQPRTEEEEKEYLEQKIFKWQVKYYKKFGQAPKDLFTEAQQSGKLDEMLNKPEKMGKNTDGQEIDPFDKQEKPWEKYIKNKKY